MNGRDEQQPSQPEEEQLAQLAQRVPPPSSEDRMLRDLREVYTTYTQEGEHVWARLAERLAERGRETGQEPFFEQSSDKKLRLMQSSRLYSMQATPSQPAPKPRRIVTMVASFLAAAILVGTLVLAFAFAHTFTHSTTAAKPTVVPTQTVTARDCPPVHDATWNRVCRDGLVQVINRTQRLANGQVLTVKGAYADNSQIVLWYDVAPVKDGSIFFAEDALATNQGISLPLLLTSGTSLGVLTADQHYQWTASFNANNLPAGLQVLGLQVKENIGFMVSGPSGKEKHMDEADLAFTVWMLRTLELRSGPVNVTAKDIALSLNRVTVSHVGTTIDLLLPSDAIVTTDKLVCVLLINNKKLSMTENNVSFVVGKAGVGQSSIAINFNYDLTAQPGAWTFTLSLHGQTQSWEFHFTVS